MKISFIKLAVLSSFLWVGGVHADWSLQGEESSLHFVSIKKDTVGEVHSFKQLTGKIANSGEFQFSVQLGGVETNIPIRNERMNEFLFEVAKFPLAAGRGKVDMTVVKNLTVGSVKSMTVPVTIELHGKSLQKDVMLQVAKLSAEKLWVVTAAPFLIDTAEFDLTPGVDKLRELAALPNIAQAVPVSASLMFVSDSTEKSNTTEKSKEKK
jgi:hypothetical protein